MGCRACGQPIQGSYKLALQRGDEIIDLGTQSRSLGYVVNKLGMERVKRVEFGNWDVYVTQGFSPREFRGVLALSPNAVDFDQKAQPLQAVPA